MTRPEWLKNCTVECERTVECVVCHRTKKPVGRDSRDNGLCQSDCHGYSQDPQPGHLWPGELSRCEEFGQ